MTLVFILAFLVGLLMLYAYTRPNSYLVNRKLTIAAPAKTIMPYLRNLQEGVKWSEWEKIDPNGSRTYSGPKGAVGSVYEWDSQNRQAGAGRQEITALSDIRVEVDLQFIRPMAGRAKVDYILEPVGNATVVTIAFTSTTSFLQKMMCLFFRPEKIIGSMHDKSLHNLRALVEGQTSVSSRMDRSVASTQSPAAKTKKAGTASKSGVVKKTSTAKPKKIKSP
ncbi:MAG: SRPBCC family protein [Candidatus Pacebacteria bacterium]|nr:SRPBCC family protein [Candidatus Paceibacterota bacterium]